MIFSSRRTASLAARGEIKSGQNEIEETYCGVLLQGVHERKGCVGCTNRTFHWRPRILNGLAMLSEATSVSLTRTA